jgi:hypothetical protein
MLAAHTAGDFLKQPVTIREITEAFVVHAYEGQMLYCGSDNGLLVPYADQWPAMSEEKLEYKLFDAVSHLLNGKWWDLPLVDDDLLVEYSQMMILKNDAGPVWERLWACLFDAEVLPPDQFLVGAEATPPSKANTPIEIDRPAVGSDSVNGGAQIEGETYNRLVRALASFPQRYPEYRDRPPKLDDDVRPWMAETGLAVSDAERRVFGAILREHFKI